VKSLKGNWRSNLRNLQPFILRHWRKGVLGALLILFVTLLAFPQPLIYRFLIDKVILAKNLNLLLWVILLMIGVKVLEKGMGVLQQFYFTRFEQEILLDIQKDLFEHTLRLPKSFFDSKETGYLMSRLSSDVGGLQWFFSSTLVYILSQTLRFLGGVVFLFVLEWRLAIVALVPIPFLVLGVRYFAQKTHTLSYASMEQQAMVSRQIQESLSSTSLIKAFALEKNTVNRLISKLKAARQLVMERTTVSSFANLVINFLPEIANAIVLIVGVIRIIGGDWTLGSLLAFQGYLGYVFGPAQYLAFANLDLQNALAALERVSALYDIVPEDRKGGIQVEHLQGDVEFRNVSFSYNEKEPVLRNISCHIQAGEHVAIVGPSGVGKTTLVSLLLRFYKSTQGKIWFDGKPSSDYNLNSLRQRIGYVSQGTLLLTGTILENLRYGNPRASQAQVEHAAKVAGIHVFIIGLSKGYNSRVGERGVNFSEGQKQRLSIARALIKDPDILILDEPTSSLDSLVEKSIFDALPSFVKSKTLFIVAHRLATVQHSDRILLLNENKLVAVGTHQTLLAENEFYQSMVKNQQVLTI
jgi:ABC-type multidrug transport system fused ATPase/permease subunit